MGTYLLSGTMMRLALQQGYHRDPSQFPNLSVFQGEMRRRVWSAVSQHDLLFSVQIGLPKCIRYAECDTQPPRNLLEEELYEDMKELPPSRPLREDTEISYQVVKLHIMRVYGYAYFEFLFSCLNVSNLSRLLNLTNTSNFPVSMPRPSRKPRDLKPTIKQY
jgi:Fungal specific transcription factor domain